MVTKSRLVAGAAEPVAAAPAAVAAPRRVRRKAARPGELLDAALHLFVERGYAATRVEDVAARAGVSKGTLFLYFANKEALFRAVVQHHIGGRLVQWRVALEHFEGDTPTLLRVFMLKWWDEIGNTPASGISKLVMGEAGSFPEVAAFYAQEVVQPGHALVRSMLERARQRGELREVDLESACQSVLAPLIFLLLWKHSIASCCPALPASNPLAFLLAQVDILTHGLCRSAAPAAGALLPATRAHKP